MLMEQLRMANILLRAAQITSRDDLREALVDEAIGISKEAGDTDLSYAGVDAFLLMAVDNTDPKARTKRSELWQAYQDYCENLYYIQTNHFVNKKAQNNERKKPDDAAVAGSRSKAYQDRSGL